ncbi:MAG: bifunctional metallophosphatase/5'-nucleotidase [Oligoflexia bacterium]|nr:bifunctional metallophosphatase/5'-nucleotidase [Oligoflexia bacterium]
MQKLFFYSLSFIVLFSCSSIQNRDPASERKEITLVALTDFHGALEGEIHFSKNSQEVQQGGAALIAGYIQAIRSGSGNPVVIVDAGDLFQGSMVSNLAEGEPVIRFYNTLGVSAAAIGNHEFDYGPVGRKSVPTVGIDDAQGALKQRITQANFPFLAANIKDHSNRTPDWVKTSVIEEISGMKVGIIGIADDDTLNTTNAMNLRDLRFEDPYLTILAEAKKLRNQNVDFVIVAIHKGSGCTDNSPSSQDNLKTCGKSAILSIAEKLPRGLVDAMVAGHTHRGVAKRVNDIAILQPHSHGKYLGVATLRSHARPDIIELLPICSALVRGTRTAGCDQSMVEKSTSFTRPVVFGQRVLPNQEVERLLREDFRKVEAIKKQSLGVTTTATFKKSFGSESPLGNLLADLSKNAISRLDLGMSNGGGLRSTLPKGRLVYGDFYAVLPFDNQFATMTVSGDSLEKLIKLGAFGGQGALSFSSNLSAEIEDCNVKNLQIDGKPVVSSKLYTVGTSDFLAGGGVGIADLALRELKTEVFWDDEYILRDLLIAALKRGQTNLDPSSFYSSSNPRIKVSGKCRR